MTFGDEKNFLTTESSRSVFGLRWIVLNWDRSSWSYRPLLTHLQLLCLGSGWIFEYLILGWMFGGTGWSFDAWLVPYQLCTQNGADSNVHRFDPLIAKALHWKFYQHPYFEVECKFRWNIYAHVERFNVANCVTALGYLTLHERRHCDDSLHLPWMMFVHRWEINFTLQQWIWNYSTWEETG